MSFKRSEQAPYELNLNEFKYFLVKINPFKLSFN